MIDTHSHILPGIDDGSNSFNESVRMAKIALSEGVRTIFATPHCCNGIYSVEKGDILKACSGLTKRLKKEGLFVQILPGAEIRINHNLIQEFDKGRLMTLNNAGTYILLELPSVFLTGSINVMIRLLCKKGVIPIIAHPERNPMILNTPGIVADLIYNGAAMQITASSLVGDFGKQAMKAAREMVVMGQVFSLGSDIHPFRKYRMARARKKLIKLAGQKTADLITHENPSAILQSNCLPCEIQQNNNLQHNFL